jgi:hypothetical protein
MLEKPEGAIKNDQSRNTCYIEHTRHRAKTKKTQHRKLKNEQHGWTLVLTKGKQFLLLNKLKSIKPHIRFRLKYHTLSQIWQEEFMARICVLWNKAKRFILRSRLSQYNKVYHLFRTTKLSSTNMPIGSWKYFVLFRSKYLFFF